MSKSGLPVFIPLWGPYWEDAMEVCREPMGKICRHDILSTLAGGNEEGAVLASPAPMDWVRSVAVCKEPMSADPPRIYGSSAPTMSQRSDRAATLPSLWTIGGNLLFAIEYFVSTVWNSLVKACTNG